MSKTLSTLIVALLALALAACSSTPSVEETASVEEINAGGAGDGSADGTDLTDTGGDGSGGDGVSSAGMTEGSGDGLGSSESMGDEADLLSKRRVYFEFDSSALDEESKAIIEAHSNHLVNNFDLTIVLEGHADERGTREYNLALGERRAKAVSQLMEALGVESDRMQVVSYGEERPVALGQDEAAFQLNRRVEIIYGNE